MGKQFKVKEDIHVIERDEYVSTPDIWNALYSSNYNLSNMSYDDILTFNGILRTADFDPN